ncbi:hypothetical protein A6R68_03776, partial [Neotoma lepida]
MKTLDVHPEQTPGLLWTLEADGGQDLPYERRKPASSSAQPLRSDFRINEVLSRMKGARLCHEPDKTYIYKTIYHEGIKIANSMR